MRRVNKKGMTVRILSLIIFAAVVFSVILFSSHNLSLGAPGGGGVNTCTSDPIVMLASPSTAPTGSNFGASADASNWINCICSSYGIYQSVTGIFWTMNFNDGTPAYSTTADVDKIFQNHVYTTTGTKTISATLEVTCGNITSWPGSASTSVSVTPANPSINATTPAGPSSVNLGNSATYNSTFTWIITNATVGLYQYANGSVIDSCVSPTTTSPITKSCSFTFNDRSTTYQICAEGTSQ